MQISSGFAILYMKSLKEAVFWKGGRKKQSHRLSGRLRVLIDSDGAGGLRVRARPRISLFPSDTKKS